MKFIKIGQTNRARKTGFTIVDDADFPLLSKIRWNFAGLGYVQGFIKRDGIKKKVLMHRLILQAPKELQVDHIDGDKQNNQRSNLRLATGYDNQRNRPKPKANKSGYKGVHKIGHNKWRAQIRNGTRILSLGSYPSPEAAAIAYDKAAKKIHGAFALTNEL